LAIDCAGYADFATIIYNIFGYNTYPIKTHNHTATIVKVGNNSYVLDINYRNKLTDLREWIKEVGKTPWVGCGNNVSSMFNLGILLKKLKRYEEAEKEYREAIKINPNLAYAHNNLGILLQNLKRYEEAEKEYREAIKINPNLAYAHNNLGILLKKLKRYEEAAIFLKKAQQINPKFKSTELCKDIEELDKEIRERGGPLAIYTEKTTMTI